MNDFNASVIINSFLDYYKCNNERGVTNDELADIIVTYLSAQNTELKKNLKLLKDIENLDDNWDTEGAKASNTDIINVVRKELPFLLYHPCHARVFHIPAYNLHRYPVYLWLYFPKPR